MNVQNLNSKYKVTNLGSKYEVTYWDHKQHKEVSELYTDSLFEAFKCLHKLEKVWACVSIRFRRNKVKYI